MTEHENCDRCLRRTDLSPPKAKRETKSRQMPKRNSVI